MPTFETADACTLHYEDVGNGPPVVLVHGAVSSARCFESHIPSLADQGFRVVAPDLRGMGRSGRFTEMPATAWNDDLIGLMDHLGLESAHLCGTSLGSRIVLRTAIDHPHRVLSIVADAPVIADSARGARAVRQLFVEDVPPDFAKLVEQWNGEDWRKVMENFLVLREVPGLQEHYDLSNRVEAISCPTFITRGDLDDPIHPLAHAVEMHNRIEGSRLWIAPDTGFSAMRFRSEIFLDHYARFVAQLPVLAA